MQWQNDIEKLKNEKESLKSTLLVLKQKQDNINLKKEALEKDCEILRKKLIDVSFQVSQKETGNKIYIPHIYTDIYDHTSSKLAKTIFNKITPPPKKKRPFVGGIFFWIFS